MSNKQIETVNGTYFFEEKYLQTGGAKINKKISEDNLLIFNEVLNSRKLDFYLIR